MIRLVDGVARLVSAICVLLLAALVVFDAQAERFTAGQEPAQFNRGLDAERLDDYGEVTGVAHNAGDDVGAAERAVAYGVDVVEIDVTRVTGALHASHDAPVPLIAPLVFRGPTLEEAWEAARLRDTVLLHLKERSSAYLSQVASFLESRRDRRVTIQTGDLGSLETLRRTVPWAKRLLLVFDSDDLRRAQTAPAVAAAVDGVSVRERLLTVDEHRRLERKGFETYAWTVNDLERANELIAGGLDGVITDRLDLMALLGGRRELP